MEEKRYFILTKENGQDNAPYNTFVEKFDGLKLYTTKEITDSKLFEDIGDAMKESVSIYDLFNVRYKVEALYLY